MNDIFNTDVPLKTETPAFAKHVLPAVPSSEVYLEDCVTALKRYADNHFDLAIVDPPYGINWTKTINYSEKQKIHQNKKGYKTHSVKEWDNAIPTAEYWSELFRVSKNQIVWGANYMTEFLPPSRCWIVWDKKGENFTAINNELAWTSFESRVKIFSRVNGMDKGFMNKDGGGIHPTEKPVALYAWVLHHYAQPNDLILDTHLGSGSSRIAAYKGGFNFVGFEIDSEYYEKQEKRFNDFKSQLRLF
jgi:site-specific DNA-methyltransferase (adenine-specific)